jgi:hypothetical protein
LKCPNCSTINEAKAEFCKKCGTALKDSDSKDTEDKKKSYEKNIEERIEKAAEEFGKRAERIGKKIEHRFEHTGRYFESWADNTFGLAGPLIVSFIVLIILRIVIWVMSTIGENNNLIGSIGVVLYDYLLIIFISILISSYNSYLFRKYKPQYYWFSPAVSSVSFIIGLWVFAKILLAIDMELNIAIIATIGSIIEEYIIVLFFVVLLIGYGFMLISSSFDKK